MLLDSNQIKMCRRENGWTQDQFAELCSLSVRTIQRIEKTGIASIESTNAIASVLSIEKSNLLLKEGVIVAKQEFSFRILILSGMAMFLIGLLLGYFI